MTSSSSCETVVLVGFAEAMAAPEVVWSLVDDGFKVVAFARKGKPSALRHSRHVVCHEICPPEKSLESSLADLHSLMVSLGGGDGASQRILFPLDDKAVWLASKAKLSQGWLMAGPTGANAELALNKCMQVQAALEAGLDVPKTRLVRTAENLRAFAAAESFPIILKAAEAVPVRDGRVQGCRKWICANQDELEHAITEWSERAPLLAQPFIQGTGGGVFGLAAADGVRAWSAHRRLRMMNPQGSGSSACISQPISDALKAKVDALVRNTGWRGGFMIELLRDDAGRDWFVELNGRPWGSMALSRCQGLEYPAWHVRLAMAPDSPVGTNLSSSAGVVCRHIGREFMHLLFVLKGARSKALRNWPSFWTSLAGILRVHRGDGLYNWRRDDKRVFFADFYYTVHDNVFKAKVNA